MQTDRNFDDIAEKFNHNIYGSSKGRIRQALLWDELEPLIKQCNKPLLKILDVGGGQGQMAIQLAKQGHDVTIVDHSHVMIDEAKKNAEIEMANITFIHSAAQELSVIYHQQFDLVLCHAVLEWIADQPNFILTLKKLIKPNGYLSLMFYNKTALLFKSITLGNFGYVSANLNKRKKKTLSPDFPCEPNTIYHLLAQNNLLIIEKQGIRVFNDYVMAKPLRDAKFDELLTLERQFCKIDPFLSLGRYIHLICRVQ